MEEAEVVDLLSSDDEEEMSTPAPQQAAPAHQAATAPQEMAGPSEPELEPEAEPDDIHVAQLVDMGFTPEQATTVRYFPCRLCQRCRHLREPIGSNAFQIHQSNSQSMHPLA